MQLADRPDRPGPTYFSPEINVFYHIEHVLLSSAIYILHLSVDVSCLICRFFGFFFSFKFILF